MNGIISSDVEVLDQIFKHFTCQGNFVINIAVGFYRIKHIELYTTVLGMIYFNMISSVLPFE